MVLDRKEIRYTDMIRLREAENTSEGFQERQVGLEIDVILAVHDDDLMNAVITTIDREERSTINGDGGDQLQFMNAPLRGDDFGEGEKFHLVCLVRLGFRLTRDMCDCQPSGHRCWLRGRRC